jgi:hypothetical protein
MKINTLDEIVSLLTCMIKEHKDCKEEILLIDDEINGIYFFCGNNKH